MTIWDDFFGNNTYPHYYTNRSSDFLTNNWYINMLREVNDMMDDALNEAAPIEQPKTKVVSTKVVERNGKTYRITVEQILPEELPKSDDTSVSDEEKDFDSDFTEENI